MYGGWLCAEGAHNGEKGLVPFNDWVWRVSDVGDGLNVFIGRRHCDLGLQAATEYREGQENRRLSHIFLDLPFVFLDSRVSSSKMSGVGIAIERTETGLYLARLNQEIRRARGACALDWLFIVQGTANHRDET